MEKDNHDLPTNQDDVKDTKPSTTGGEDGATSNEHINLKVVGSDSSEVMFKIKRTTKLSKLMQAYCSRVGQASNSLRFLVDGERISGDDTPNTLDLEDGSAIDAMREQVGGGNIVF